MITDLGWLDTAYLLQLTGRNIELDATMSAMTTIPDIKQEYWTNCPMQSTENEFQGLKGDIHFVDTVDHLVSIQRGLRLKDVWICTMNIIAKERREAILEEWLSEVPFAIENMLGT
jgi:hypothetical protein